MLDAVADIVFWTIVLAAGLAVLGGAVLVYITKARPAEPRLTSYGRR